ncbi:MAG: PAS domain S-box protein [Gemmatimonadetes bacterium]|nr:PAS domain S-box protein [Gemmatimonadota bacterium]
MAESHRSPQADELNYPEIVARAPIGIYQSLPDGSLVIANPALARILGYDSVVELLGVNMRDLYRNPEERTALVASFERVGTSAELELEWKRKDGEPIWVQVNAHTVLNPRTGRIYFEGFVRDVTRRRRNAQELRVHREQLAALSQRLLEVQETERRYLARELHDEVGQLLTAAKLTLQALHRARSPAAGKGLLREALTLVDQCLRQVRSLSLELRPSLLDDLGLAAAVRWYLERQAERAGFAAQLEDHLREHRLPTDVETTCFRVVQEAITNVARHAQASRVDVSLAQRDGGLDLLVRDDGVGFDVAAARQRAAAGDSLGLLGMEERVALVGGRLQVESGPGRGTEVRVNFPLGAAPRDSTASAA